MTESIDSNTIVEDTDDKVVIHLIINIKCIVIVADLGFPFLNIPHDMGIVFRKTRVRY